MADMRRSCVEPPRTAVALTGVPIVPALNCDEREARAGVSSTNPGVATEWAGKNDASSAYVNNGEAPPLGGRKPDSRRPAACRGGMCDAAAPPAALALPSGSPVGVLRALTMLTLFVVGEGDAEELAEGRSVPPSAVCDGMGRRMGVISPAVVPSMEASRRMRSAMTGSCRIWSASMREEGFFDSITSTKWLKNSE